MEYLGLQIGLDWIGSPREELGLTPRLLYYLLATTLVSDQTSTYVDRAFSYTAYYAIGCCYKYLVHASANPNHRESYFGG